MISNPIPPSSLQAWVLPAWTVAGFAVLGLLLQLAARRLGPRLTRLTKGRFDDFIVQAVTPYLGFWCLLMGLTAATASAPLRADQLALIRQGLAALLILTISLSIASLVSTLIKEYGSNFGLGVADASLPRTLARCLILGLGIVTILSQLGIAMGPLLTALGVGSLAVALALQDTFANFFSGFYVMASRQVRVGDYVKLDSGQEGYIDDISWRSCRMRELNGNYIIIPNQKLAQAIVYNYDRPQKELSLVFSLGVAYTNDLGKVEAVTCAVAKEALQSTPGAVAGFEPFIRYSEFSECAIRFSVILKIQSFVDRYLLIHEFMKRLHARYRSEGIDLALPQREIRVTGGNLGPEFGKRGLAPAGASQAIKNEG